MLKPYEKQEYSVAIAGGHGYQDLLATAARAEETGLSTCWISEDYFYGGAMATAGALAALTKSIRIAVGVINPYTRHPALAAMEAAAVDLISGGRFQLAMGSSNKRWIEDKMGIPFQKPITAVSESVQIIREMLCGGKVDFDGQVFQVRDAELDFPPYRTDMPVFMGIRGTRALRLAGAVADGVLLSIMSTAPYVRYARQMIDEGAREAGRDPGEVKLSAYIPLYVGDTEEGRVRMASILSTYVAHSVDKPFVTESGLALETALKMRDTFFASGDAAALVTGDIADLFGVLGTAEHCRQRLQEYRDAGLDEPVLCEYGGVSAAQQMGMLVDSIL